MEIPDNLLSLYHAQANRQHGSYVFEIPAHEVDVGTIQPGQSYRVAVLSPVTEVEPGSGSNRELKPGASEPPIVEGETVEVEIEEFGEQGDGIARIGPGYIVFVPDVVVRDRVTIEITQVRENFAFGEVIEGPY